MKPRILNWLKPDHITIAGIICIALYFRGYIDHDWLFIVIGFGGAVLSDLIDGWWARYTGQITPFGRILDAIRDRLMLFSFFGHLFAWGMVNGVIFVLMWFSFLSEVLIWLVRGLCFIAAKNHVGTNPVGKLRQGMHVFVMSAVLADFHFFPELQQMEPSPNGMVVIAVMSIMAFISYVTQAIRATLTHARNQLPKLQ